MTRKEKIKRLKDLHSGRLPLSVLLPKRLKLRVGYGDYGSCINGKPVSSEVFIKELQEQIKHQTLAKDFLKAEYGEEYPV